MQILYRHDCRITQRQTATTHIRPPWKPLRRHVPACHRLTDCEATTLAKTRLSLKPRGTFVIERANLCSHGDRIACRSREMTGSLPAPIFSMATLSTMPIRGVRMAVGTMKETTPTTIVFISSTVEMTSSRISRRTPWRRSVQPKLTVPIPSLCAGNPSKKAFAMLALEFRIPPSPFDNRTQSLRTKSERATPATRPKPRVKDVLKPSDVPWSCKRTFAPTPNCSACWGSIRHSRRPRETTTRKFQSPIPNRRR